MPFVRRRMPLLSKSVIFYVLTACDVKTNWVRFAKPLLLNQKQGPPDTEQSAGRSGLLLSPGNGGRTPAPPLRPSESVPRLAPRLGGQAKPEGNRVRYSQPESFPHPPHHMQLSKSQPLQVSAMQNMPGGQLLLPVAAGPAAPSAAVPHSCGAVYTTIPEFQ